MRVERIIIIEFSSLVRSLVLRHSTKASCRGHCINTCWLNQSDVLRELKIVTFLRIEDAYFHFQHTCKTRKQLLIMVNLHQSTYSLHCNAVYANLLLAQYNRGIGWKSLPPLTILTTN